MPTQLDWVAANTAALVSDIIALQPFHFLREHPLCTAVQAIDLIRIACQAREHCANLAYFVSLEISVAISNR